MPTDATRAALVDAATAVFAEDGVAAASLIEITRRAGQRNRAAVHYHFGGREGLLVAVLDQYTEFLARREGEMLAIARTRPDDDVASVIEAIARPTAELAASGWRGACYLSIVADLVEDDPATLPDAVTDALARTGGEEVYALLRERMTPCDEALRIERLSLLTSFLLGSVARRARGREGGRPQLPYERFVEHLVDLGAAMMTAPVRPV